jgi:NurA-like 5'-3' nuclease
MLNAIENAIEVVRKAAREQSDRIVSELNSDFDNRNVALAMFNDLLKQARSMREQADSIEREACEALNSALTASGGVSLSIVNQMIQGQMVTSHEVPSNRRIAAKAEEKKPDEP